MDSRQWSFSVLRAHGLQHIHKDKTWKPIVCVSVDCSAGSENHCPTYETVLGTDGQNPNQKEVFILPNFPRPTSKLTISVHYRSTSKKKAKKRVLVASCTCSIGELVQLQRQEPKPHLRLTTHSNSFTKSSKTQKSPAIVKRSSSSASGSLSGNPTNRLGYATVQVRLVIPAGLEADKDWRRFGLHAKWSLDSQLETWSESESRSERGGEHELVSSPTSSKASAWPTTPVSPSLSRGDEFTPLLPSSPSSSSSRQHRIHNRDEVNRYPHQSTGNTLRRRRRRRKQIMTGYSLDDDFDEGERWVSESCTSTDSESGRKDAHLEKGYQSATPSYHSQYAGDDDDDEEDSPSRSQPHQHQENGHRWYTEVIRITSTIVDFMPMLDPGILPTFRTRNGVVDVDLADCKFDGADEEVELESEDGIDTASVYSNATQPEQEPGHLRREENLNTRPEGSRSKLSLTSSGSGTLVASSPRGSFRSFSGSSGWLKDKERKKSEKKVQDTAEAIGIKTWWEKLFCAFTMYAEMKKAGELCGLVERSGHDEGKGEEQISEKGSVVTRDLETGQEHELEEEAELEWEEAELRRKFKIQEGRHQFEMIFQRLQVEWKYVAGILVALAAVDIAVFAISSDSLIQVNNIALSAVAASSIFTGLGIVCDVWFLLRFLGCDVDTFLSRSFDHYYQTHLFFSLNSRIPALCLFLSTISLLGFLAVTAFSTFPIGSGIICFLVGLGLGLQFVVRGVEVVGRVIDRSLKWIGKGGMRIVAFPLNLVRWKAASRNTTAAADTARSDEVSVDGQAKLPSGSKPRLKIPALLRNIGNQKQKVTEPAKGEDSGEKKWRGRYEKAKAKTKTKTQVKARAEEEGRKKDLEKNQDLRAEMAFGSLTRV